MRFDQLLDMEPYCCREASPKDGPGAAASSPRRKRFLYDLSAVVMHHGKGFGSGHYTSYCYNTEGGECGGCWETSEPVPDASVCLTGFFSPQASGFTVTTLR